MSLNAEDRSDIIAMMIAGFLMLWVTGMVHTWGSGIRHRATMDALDDLCRAHYPECIVETKP